MTSTNTIGISGNVVGEKFVFQKKEVNVLEGLWFYIQVCIEAHVDAATTTAVARLNITRGSADSYIEVPFVV